MRREWMLHVLPPVGAACAGRTKPPGDMQSGREIHGVLRKRAFPAEGDCRLSVSAFPGAGERGAGGSEASPAHRGASEANLKVERLAQPISRPEHQRAARRDGAQQGGSEASPAHRRVSEANLKVERFGEKAIAWPFRKKADRNTGMFRRSISVRRRSFHLPSKTDRSIKRTLRKNSNKTPSTERRAHTA